MNKLITRLLLSVFLGLWLFEGSVSLAQAPNPSVPIAAVNLTAQEQQTLADFASWVNGYLQRTGPAGNPDPFLDKGIDLARQRREVLLRLIPLDPEKAVTLSLSNSIRRKLPEAILHELETPVAGLGDLLITAALSTPGGPAVIPIERRVRLNGEVYQVFVGGWRNGEGSKYGIPLSGVVLDNLLALDPKILREIPAEEVDGNSLVTDLRTSTEKAGTNPAVWATMGGQIYRFASVRQVEEAEARLEESESKIGPIPVPRAAELIHEEPGASTGVVPANTTTPWTVGNKKVLVIRIDFADRQGDPKGTEATYTQSYVSNLLNTQISPYYVQSSYNQTSLSNTVTTKVYRMPLSSHYYAVSGANDQLHQDAENAAAADYSINSYSRIIVLFSNLGSIPGSLITYGGLSVVGGSDVWVNGEFDFRVVAHELGHTYGLYHANLAQVYDGNPVSNGYTSKEYGDDFDTMGGNDANDTRTDFNPWFKNLLGWINDAKVKTVTANGTFRISRFDNSSGAGTLLALKIARDATHNYWIGCRRKFTTNASMQNGAYIVWGYHTNEQSDLLDMTTPGKSDQDAALAVGATFNDPGTNVIIHPSAKGGTSPNEYMDVQITFEITRDISLSGNMAFGNVGVGQTKVSMLTIKNTGNSTLAVSSISYPTGFSGSYSGNIPAGSSHTVMVTFAPTSVKSYSGTLTVNSNKTSGTNTIPVSGAGITATKIINLSGTMAFGDVGVGTTKSSVLTIRNNGNANLTVTGISYPVGFSGNFVGTIFPGSFYQIPVAFKPTALQVYSGTMTVHCDNTGGGDSLPISGTGVNATRIVDIKGALVFGDVPVGTLTSQYFKIHNAGNAPLTVTSITCPTGFGCTWSGVIAANASMTMYATFKPTAAIEYSGKLIVNSDATSGKNTKNLSGTGIPATRIISLSGNMNFGTLPIGTRKTSDLTIANTGNTILNVTSIVYPPGYTGPWQGNIQPGESKVITVTFIPTAAQSYNGNITVNSNKTGGGNIKYASGAGVVATRIIGVSGNMAFGNVQVYGEKDSPLFISNTGNTDLVVTSITYPDGYNGNWEGTIPAGTSQGVTIFFYPMSAKTYNGNLVVHANQTSGTNSKPISGTGYE